MGNNHTRLQNRYEPVRFRWSPLFRTWLNRCFSPLRKGSEQASVNEGAVFNYPHSWSVMPGQGRFTRARLAHGWALTVFCGAVVSLAVMPQMATSKPCAKHTGKAKVECQAHRAKQAWPKGITWPELEKRTTRYERDALLWICKHEQPRADRWKGCWWDAPYTAFVGAYGMASSTYGIGAAVTGYPYPPVATPAEQTAVAVIVMRRFGPSAWDSWGSR